MKKLFIFIFFFISSNICASEIKLEKIVEDLDKPWSLTFVDKDNIIFNKAGTLIVGKLDNNNKICII